MRNMKRRRLSQTQLLQNENEALRVKIQNLELTLQTYQDENTKFEAEKMELTKQIGEFREKAEEAESREYLKSQRISNLEQQLNELSEENMNYAKQIKTYKENLQTIQERHNQVKQENGKYQASLHETQKRLESATQNCESQKAELFEVQHQFAEIRDKYDELTIENSCFQQENEQLNIAVEEISKMESDCHEEEEQHDRNGVSVRWRCRRTEMQSKLEEYSSLLSLQMVSPNVTPSNHRIYCGNNNTMTVPITPNSKPNSCRTPNARPLFYNFESPNYLALTPRNLTMNRKYDGDQSPAESVKHEDKQYQVGEAETKQEEESDVNVEAVYQTLLEKQQTRMLLEREEMETEWRQKLEALKLENEKLKRAQNNGEETKLSTCTNKPCTGKVRSTNAQRLRVLEAEANAFDLNDAKITCYNANLRWLFNWSL
mmetsp:Transcript_63022/g.100124  ORF Transcript_63022/g.100124 Transcript_63022/m.100124 type:complete len:431 (+) Transcript_63022:52-1344(+)